MRNTVSLLRYLNVSNTVRERCGPYGLVRWVMDILERFKVGAMK